MNRWPSPDEHIHYLDRHIAVLLHSFTHWTGRPLLDPGLGIADPAHYLFHTPFAVVSHDADPNPLFSCGNLTALALFEMGCEEFTAMPSRLSSEPQTQAERQRLLATAAQRGYIDDYLRGSDCQERPALFDPKGDALEPHRRGPPLLRPGGDVRYTGLVERAPSPVRSNSA